MISATPRTVLVAVTVAAAAVAALLAPAALGSAPARAHAGLDAATPADGEQLDAAPEAVTLTFTEAVLPDFLQLAVTGPDGAAVTAGPVTVDGPVVRQQVAITGAGAHVVAYRVVSADGHPVTGQLTFTVTGAAASPGAATTDAGEPSPTTPAFQASAAPTPASATSGTDGMGWWWLAGTVAVAGAGLALLSRRRTKDPR